MGCPVHIWAPMMAAAAPFARMARDRVRAALPGQHTTTEEAPREMHRWAPVGTAASDEPAPSGN